jgi:hypothetical protein
MLQSVRCASCLFALMVMSLPAWAAPATAPAAAPAGAAPAPAEGATPAAAAAPAASAAPAGDPSATPPGFPEPSLYPKEWEFKFEHKMPKRIVVDDPKSGKRNAYWYMTYTVTNPTEKPIEFTPSFQLLSQNSKSFEPVRSDLGIPTVVFQTIFNREGNKFLESARKIQGTLNPGVEQARDGVAIWPEPQTRMGRFEIFVGGLSGEYAIMKKQGGRFVQIDLKKAAEELKGVPESDRITLRKTLQLSFHIPGDEIRPGEDPVMKKGQKWVMR